MYNTPSMKKGIFPAYNMTTHLPSHSNHHTLEPTVNLLLIAIPRIFNPYDHGVVKGSLNNA